MNDLKLTVSSLGYTITQLSNLIMSNQGKTYRVSIKEWREKRSLSQNSMYWAWLSEIQKQNPLQVDSGAIEGNELWHEVFKKYFCPVKSIRNENAVLQTQSTKLLDVGEMTHYLNRIEQWCIDRGIKLTIPADSEYSKLMESQTQ
jgi:hypothetical protein